MVRCCLQLVVTRDYFYCLQSHDRPVNGLSTAVQLTNQLLRFWADRGFVFYKRVSSPSFLVSSQFLIVITTLWFAIALDEIRTRRSLREKAGLQVVCAAAFEREGEGNQGARPRAREEGNACKEAIVFAIRPTN